MWTASRATWATPRVGDILSDVSGQDLRRVELLLAVMLLHTDQARASSLVGTSAKQALHVREALRAWGLGAHSVAVAADGFAASVVLFPCWRSAAARLSARRKEESRWWGPWWWRTVQTLKVVDVGNEPRPHRNWLRPAEYVHSWAMARRRGLRPSRVHRLVRDAVQASDIAEAGNGVGEGLPAPATQPSRAGEEKGRRGSARPKDPRTPCGGLVPIKFSQ